MTSEAQFEGALLGCAIGDALGAPLEGMTREEIRQQYGLVTDFLPGRFGIGRITDDTAFTIALAESIVEAGGFDPDRAAAKFGELIRRHDEGSEEVRGLGYASVEGSRQIYRGVSRQRSGIASATCGAAMRVSPIGLLYYRDLARLKQAAIDQSLITHTDQKAVAGAVAIAYGVAYSLRDFGSLIANVFLGETAEFVRDVDAEMANKIAGVAYYLEHTFDEGLLYTGNSDLAIEAVPAALLAFAKTPFEFENVVIEAANAGGDTDSIGAMAGAMAGALTGSVVIPERWLKPLEKKDRLAELARELFRLAG